MMKKQAPPASADAYVKGLSGWRKLTVETLRSAMLKPARFEEVIKWGHLVYLSNGPAALIRAEDERVLFGFWRGARLIELAPDLKPGGKYEMATLTFRNGDAVNLAQAKRLAAAAHRLNAELGDPTKV